MDKFSKEHAEKLANEYAIDLAFPFRSPIDDVAEHFAEGCYLKSLDETNAALLQDALLSIHHRMMQGIELGLTAHEAYDSFYQELATEALNKAK